MSVIVSVGLEHRVRTLAYGTLVGVSLFHCLSAVGGGIGMVVADGLSMPKSLLADSPVSTFLLPGLILALVVGGTQTLAFVRLLQRRQSALLWSAVAGFGMVIWIIAEIGFIHSLMWAQLIYVISGLLQLLLVFSLLGIASWLPRDMTTQVSPSRPYGRDRLRSSRGAPVADRPMRERAGPGLDSFRRRPR
jgi:hypothetical protein